MSLKPQQAMIVLFLLWLATKSSARTAFACGGLKTIETIGTIFSLLASRHRKEKRIVPIVSETSASKKKLSLLSLKKNKRAKNNPLVLLFIFCFLRFLYNRLFPIRLVFSNCILYIGFSQLYWFFLIVFYILAFPNYIGFSNCILYIGFSQLYCLFPNCLYSAPVNCPIKKMAPVARSFMM